MAYHQANENLAVSISHDGNESEVIARYIKHRVWRDIVGTAEASPQICKINKPRVLRNGVPIAQGLFGFRMFAPEVTQHFQRNDMQV